MCAQNGACLWAEVNLTVGRYSYLLNRMDAMHDSPLGETVPLKEKPSYYFQRQCWISGDPDEKAFGNVVEFVGPYKCFWASDFPHLDHPATYMEELSELVCPDVGIDPAESARRKYCAGVWAMIRMPSSAQGSITLRETKPNERAAGLSISGDESPLRPVCQTKAIASSLNTTLSPL